MSPDGRIAVELQSNVSRNGWGNKTVSIVQRDRASAFVSQKLARVGIWPTNCNNFPFISSIIMQTVIVVRHTVWT